VYRSLSRIKHLYTINTVYPILQHPHPPTSNEKAKKKKKKKDKQTDKQKKTKQKIIGCIEVSQ
jgi:hypothetical protein